MHIDDICIFDLEPEKIFINIGSDDLGFGISQSIFLANYDEILRQIKDRLPKVQVFVMAYFPVSAVADFGESANDHKELFATRSNHSLDTANHHVATLAAKHQFKFIDVNTGLTDADGNLRKELAFDGVHMLSAGYEIVLANMKQYLY